MNSDLKPSILIFGLNVINLENVNEQLKKWSYKFYNSLELKSNEYIKESIIGVLILSWRYKLAEEDLSIIYDLPNLKIISCQSSGIDHLDVNTLSKRNIIIRNCPDQTADATSDIGIILILNLARKFQKSIQEARDPDLSVYNIVQTQYMGMDIRGKTLGIVGLGKIGQQLAFKASLAFGMKVVYNQRNKRSNCNFPFYESLDEMLSVVDILVITCSLNPTTTHLIDLKRLKRMKPTAFLINISRGAVVKTNDLVEGLRCKFIAGAGLDVTDPEPLPSTHALLHMDNVIVLPHIGTFTMETEYAMMNSALANLKAALETD